MTDLTVAGNPADRPHDPFGPADAGLTPAGLQSRRVLARRRAITLALNLVVLAVLTAGMVGVFGAGGWSTSDIIILATFLVGVPWTIMGGVNALIGLWLLHGPGGRQAGLEAVAPHLGAAESQAAPAQRTAVAMTLRNEPPRASLLKLAEVRRSLDATGHGAMFDIFVLSDTTDPAIAAEEERLFEAMRRDLGGVRGPASPVYRRRRVNTGFKAGNVREFLMNEGRGYPFYLPLDSDSVMGGADILRMVRICQAHPGIGILQTLCVGRPSRSLFARLFQFGMRHGMRSFTMGAAWWQGDCGPYWGHNALIRTAAFRRHCRLPVLPGSPPRGGHILSHDQVEAAMMRRAGWEVRVLPVEGESFEENPPTILDFIKRDLRWCQGNMQYWPLLGMKGLTPVSRLQLVAAVAMYLGAPAWMLMTLAAMSKLFVADPGGMNLQLGIPMFFIMISVSFVPKIAGMLDVALTPGGVAAWGGRLRFLAGAIAETLFSILMAPVIAVHLTIFLVGLLFGRRVQWGGQRREAHGMTLAEAARAFWPQTLLGLSMAATVLVMAGPGLLVWTAPMVGGLSLAIPFAVLTASPALGRLAWRAGLAAVPDERAPGATLRALDAAEAERAGSPVPAMAPAAA